MVIKHIGTMTFGYWGIWGTVHMGTGKYGCKSKLYLWVKNNKLNMIREHSTIT